MHSRSHITAVSLVLVIICFGHFVLVVSLVLFCFGRFISLFWDLVHAN